MHDDEMKTIEEWALAKGHIKPGYNPELRYVSPVSPHHIFAPTAFNVAMLHEHWSSGAMVTEADYDTALDLAMDREKGLSHAAR